MYLALACFCAVSDDEWADGLRNRLEIYYFSSMTDFA